MLINVRTGGAMKNTILFTLLLALLMWITRGSHFDTIVSLPDASLALFLIAGFYLRARWPLVLLMLEAGALDFWATQVNGVSDYCMSPAYFFLIPTYACMWLGGRWLAKGFQWRGWDAVRLALVAVISTNLAFHISSGSFYVLSGRFSDLSWAEYGARVVAYLPSYFYITCGYLLLAALLAALLVQVRGVTGMMRPS